MNNIIWLSFLLNILVRKNTALYVLYGELKVTDDGKIMLVKYYAHQIYNI